MVHESHESHVFLSSWRDFRIWLILEGFLHIDHMFYISHVLSLISPTLLWHSFAWDCEDTDSPQRFTNPFKTWRAIKNFRNKAVVQLVINFNQSMSPAVVKPVDLDQLKHNVFMFTGSNTVSLTFLLLWILPSKVSSLLPRDRQWMLPE